MKIKTETISRDIIKYVCEVCGKESTYKDIIRKCEFSHMCEHEPFYYLIESESDYGTYKGIGIECNICGNKIEEIDLDVVEDNQIALEQIYDILKKKS